MNSAFFRFILDVQSARSQTSIPVSLNDTAITLYMSLTDGGKPYYIEEGCLAKLSITRPSGSKIHEFCRVEGNAAVVYPFSQNPATAAEEGIHECELTLYGFNGEQITTSRFSIIVNERVVNIDDNNGITDEGVGIIDTMVHNEQARRVAENGRVSAEEARVASEESRTTAEDGRATAEDARVVAEENRVAAYKKIEHDTTEAVSKILREQESIIAIQEELIATGLSQERLAEIIALQESYIGGDN